MEHENHPTFAAGPRCPGRKFEPPDTIAPHRPSATTTTTIPTTSRYTITKIINPSIPNAPRLFLRAGSKPITIPPKKTSTPPAINVCPTPRHRLRRHPANPSRPADTSPQIALTPSLMRMVSCSFSASSDMVAVFGLWVDLSWLGCSKKWGAFRRPPAVLRRASLPVKNGNKPPPSPHPREIESTIWTGEALPEQQTNWQAVTAA